MGRRVVKDRPEIRFKPNDALSVKLLAYMKHTRLPAVHITEQALAEFLARQPEAQVPSINLTSG